MIEWITNNRWNIVAALALLLLAARVDSVFYHEAATLGIVTALLLFVLGFRKASAEAAKPITITDGFFVVMISALLTALYWIRAWDQLPSGILIEPLYKMMMGFGFWWPGLLFTSLMRNKGEGWRPHSKQRFLHISGLGFGGSLLGLLIFYLV
ncbi:MAG: hypothetical protein ACNA78_03345 [Balneolaceae bacterium]